MLAIFETAQARKLFQILKALAESVIITPHLQLSQTGYVEEKPA